MSGLEGWGVYPGVCWRFMRSGGLYILGHAGSLCNGVWKTNWLYDTWILCWITLLATCSDKHFQMVFILQVNITSNHPCHGT